MSIFKDKKKTYVSSGVYNLAGDVENRTQYLKQTILTGVLAPTSNSLGETIVNSYLNGPGITQKGLYRWCLRNDYVGMPQANVKVRTNLEDADVVDELPAAPPGETLVVQSAYIDDFEVEFFAEQWILDNFPERFGDAWVADLNEDDREVTITWPDPDGLGPDPAPTPSTFIIPADQYDTEGDYLVVYYYYVEAENEETVSEGTLVEDEIVEGNLPDTTDYSQDSDSITGTTSVDLDETVDVYIEYSDATPDEDLPGTPSTTSTSYNDTHEIWTNEVFVGIDDTLGSELWFKRIINLYKSFYVDTEVVVDVLVEPDTPSPGVTKTTTTTTTTEVLKPIWDYREDTQNIYRNAPSGNPELLYYLLGSEGNLALDALQPAEVADPPSEFYPVFPIRLKNTFISADGYEDLYDEVNRAYRKATGYRLNARYSSLVDQVNESPDVDDMDYIWMVYAVPLNTPEMAGKEYLIRFFNNMKDYTQITETEWDDWKDSIAAHQADVSAYVDWYNNQRGSYDGDDPSNPSGSSYSSPPGVSRFTTPTRTVLNFNLDRDRVAEFGQLTNLVQKISWVAITDETKIGNVYDFEVDETEDAKVGTVTINNGTPVTFTTEVGTRTVERGDDQWEELSVKRGNFSETIFRWQISNTQYQELRIYGLEHDNYVYDGKYTETTATQALADEEESDFLIPMHYPTVQEMSLVDTTQLATCNQMLVINAYETVTQKWYERGIFKIIGTVILAVVAAVVFPGIFVGGILGSNAALGAGLGLTGTAAIAVGAAVNAIVAIVVTMVIEQGAIAIGGEKWGRVLSVIVSFLVMSAFANFSQTGQFGINWGQMMRAENILKLTQVAAKAYTAYVQGEMIEIQAEMEENREEYEEESAELKRLWKELGITGPVINPMILTDAFETYRAETSDQFMDRTLMTGSDVVEMSHDMVYRYAEMNTKLPLLGET